LLAERGTLEDPNQFIKRVNALLLAKSSLTAALTPRVWVSEFRLRVGLGLGVGPRRPEAKLSPPVNRFSLPAFLEPYPVWWYCLGLFEKLNRLLTGF
ncbi:hypothetical protein, partial [Enterobacter hormaechei]